MLEVLLAIGAALPVAPCPPVLQEPIEAGDAGEATPEEQLAAISSEFDAAMQAFQEELRKKPREEQAAFYEESRPDPEPYAARMLALAEAHPETEAAVNACLWVVNNAKEPATSARALDRLVAEHADDDGMVGLCRSLERRYADGAGYLEAFVERSTKNEIKGAACYSLGKLLMGSAQLARRIPGMSDEERTAYEGYYGADLIAGLAKANPGELEKRAVECLERVRAEFPEGEHWRGSLGKAAEGDLYQLRNLQVGMVAPDIEGEDIEGVPFKLSDYRGKVVVLDFWGHW